MNRSSVFVLGAQKCGTTVLADLLAQQPEIFVPSIKETYFFCDEAAFARGYDWYHQEFYAPHATGSAQLLCDATPFYLASPEALQRIADYVAESEARFIVCLRDPVARAYSAYWHQRRFANEPLDFEQALAAEPARVTQARAARQRWWRQAYVEVGRYGEHLERALGLLGRERMLVLGHDNMKDVNALQARLRKFLGLGGLGSPPGQLRENRASMPRMRLLQDLITRENPVKSFARAIVPREMRTAIGRRLLEKNQKAFIYPPMRDETRIKLFETFAEDRQRLAALGITVTPP